MTRRIVLLLLLAATVAGCSQAAVVERTAAPPASATPGPTQPAPTRTATPEPPAATASPAPTPSLTRTPAAETPTEAHPTPTPTAATPTEAPPTLTPTAATPHVQVVATGLSVPWALAFAPDGRILVTERAGRLRVIEDGALRPEPLATLPVEAIGEGGLLGLALDPGFAENGRLYLMYTYAEGSQLFNRISRFTLTGAGLGDETVLVDRIPGARYHNGGRLAIGPDGKLYAGTGDALVPQLAQDLGSLAGKILRINLDGSIPGDNPFPGSPVYSLGHRNPQGLAFQPGTAVLWAVEHGPSGEFGLCCRDELNRIVPGGNYGWPYVAGTDVVDAAQAAARDLIAPVASSGEDTWAPAGLAFYQDGPLAAWQGDLFFGALRGRHLRRVTPEGDDPAQVASEEALYNGMYGRIREVIMGPDGYLYLTTSNRDGRGQPVAEDDRVLRIGAGD